MSRFWLKKSGNGRRALASSFSLFLAFLAAFAGAQDYERLEDALRKAATPGAQRELLDRAATQNPELRAGENDLREKIALVEKEAALRRLAKPMAGDPGIEAKRIRETNPFYREKQDREASNWVKRAGENLLELLRRLIPQPGERSAPPNARAPEMGWLQPALIFLAILAFVVVVAIILWQVRLRSERRARVTTTALMDEDEPDRTLDEWLALADSLEAQGKYREAVRALFLASLMKIDEAGVARFNRRQTNWEHLARIEVSPTRPANLDFRRPTKEFDRIWYGYDVRGVADVHEFRQLYVSVKEMLTRRAA